MDRHYVLLTIDSCHWVLEAYHMGTYSGLPSAAKAF